MGATILLILIGGLIAFSWIRSDRSNGIDPNALEEAAEGPKGAKSKAPRVEAGPLRLTEGESRAFLQIAWRGAPSALEAAIASPSLAWLPGASDAAGWSSRLPLPLHDQRFVEQLLRLPSRPAIGDESTDRKMLRTLAGQVALRASGARPAGVWRSLRTPIVAADAGAAMDDRSDALVRDVFARNAQRPWTAAELGRVTRARALDRTQLREVDDELIARAWALGSHETRQPLALTDAPWLETRSQTDAPDPGSTFGFAYALILLALWIWLVRAESLPLALDYVRTAGRLPQLQLGPGVEVSPAADPEWIGRWRRALTAPTPGEIRLDLEATVRATAANGGFATLRFRRRRSLPSFSLAIERRSRRDCLAAWWIEVAAALSRALSIFRVLGVPRQAALLRIVGPLFARRALLADAGQPPAGFRCRPHSSPRSIRER